MKFLNSTTIASLFVALTFSSCMTSYEYYQVYEVAAADPSSQSEDSSLRFTDDNCFVDYNFWSNGGFLAFEVYNSSDSIMEIELQNSFFILNSFAYNYYIARTSTTSASFVSQSKESIGRHRSARAINKFVSETTVSSAVRSQTNTRAVSASQSTMELPILKIPPHSRKIVGEYYINNSYVLDCDMVKYPDKSKVSSKEYSQQSSPFEITNHIQYKLLGKDTSFVLSNSFYVKRIENHDGSNFFKREEITGCDGNKYSVFLSDSQAINRFYISYHYEF